MANYNASGGYSFDPYGGFFNKGFGKLADAGASMWNTSQNALANVYNYDAQLQAAQLASNNQLKAQQQALANQLSLGQGGLSNQLTLGQGALGNQSALINHLFGGSGGGLASLFNGLFGGGTTSQPSGGVARSPYGAQPTTGYRAAYPTQGGGYGGSMQASFGSSPYFHQAGGNPMAVYNRQFVPPNQLAAYDAVHGTQGMA